MSEKPRWLIGNAMVNRGGISDVGIPPSSSVNIMLQVSISMAYYIYGHFVFVLLEAGNLSG